MKGIGTAGLLRHVDSLALWLALGMLGLVLGLGVRSTTALIDNTAWVERTHLVIESIDDLTIGLAGAVNARRGFSLTGDQEMFDGYGRAVRDLSAAQLRLRRLTADNPDQQHRLDALEPLLGRVILLGNSWKFTGKVAAARIDFGVTGMDGEQVLFVRDNGADFDMAHASKLFAPFGRLHTVREFAGIGIGLDTAQRIVHRHGGRIWADGQVGEGAVFYFTLCPKPGMEIT